MKKEACGEEVLAISTAISCQISQNLSADDLAILGMILTVVGDQLSLLALTKA